MSSSHSCYCDKTSLVIRLQHLPTLVLDWTQPCLDSKYSAALDDLQHKHQQLK